MDRKDTAKTQACPPFTGKQGTDFLAGIVLALLVLSGGCGGHWCPCRLHQPAR